MTTATLDRAALQTDCGYIFVRALFRASPISTETVRIYQRRWLWWTDVRSVVLGADEDCGILSVTHDVIPCRSTPTFKARIFGVEVVYSIPMWSYAPSDSDQWMRLYEKMVLHDRKERAQGLVITPHAFIRRTPPTSQSSPEGSDPSRTDSCEGQSRQEERTSSPE